MLFYNHDNKRGGGRREGWYPGSLWHVQVAGGERSRAIDFQVVEAPWTLALVQKSNLQETQGRRGGGTVETEGPATDEPPRG